MAGLAASPHAEPLIAPRAFLIAGSDTPTARFFINCLAETPETVAEHLVPRIRAVPRDSRTLGGGISQACCGTGSVRAVLLAKSCGWSKQRPRALFPLLLECQPLRLPLSLPFSAHQGHCMMMVAVFKGCVDICLSSPAI